MPDLSPEDVERRLRAKRVNERLKLAASTINAIGLAIVGVAVLVPVAAGTASSLSAIWIVVAVALHFVSQVLLGILQSED